MEVEEDVKDPFAPMEWSDFFTEEETKQRLATRKTIHGLVHVGYWAVRDPRKIMGQLYLALRHLRFTWKTLNM